MNATRTELQGPRLGLERLRVPYAVAVTGGCGVEEGPGGPPGNPAPLRGSGKGGQRPADRLGQLPVRLLVREPAFPLISIGTQRGRAGTSVHLCAGVHVGWVPRPLPEGVVMGTAVSILGALSSQLLEPETVPKGFAGGWVSLRSRQ